MSGLELNRRNLPRPLGLLAQLWRCQAQGTRRALQRWSASKSEQCRSWMKARKEFSIYFRDVAVFTYGRGIAGRHIPG